jgi:hypothetical protein
MQDAYMLLKGNSSFYLLLHRFQGASQLRQAPFIGYALFSEPANQLGM